MCSAGELSEEGLRGWGCEGADGDDLGRRGVYDERKWVARFLDRVTYRNAVDALTATKKKQLIFSSRGGYNTL